jgi:hypothetical protein
MGEHDIARLNGLRLAARFELILPLARKNRPGILAVGMNVGSDALTWLDVPGNDGGVLRFSDYRADWFIIRWPHEIVALEDANLGHGDTVEVNGVKTPACPRYRGKRKAASIQALGRALLRSFAGI